jgi:hypothetical protein
MPRFTLQWENNGTHDQEWDVVPPPPKPRKQSHVPHGAHVTTTPELTAAAVYNISVTGQVIVAARLSFNPPGNWSINTHTPNHFTLNAHGSQVNLRCNA